MSQSGNVRILNAQAEMGTLGRAEIKTDQEWYSICNKYSGNVPFLICKAMGFKYGVVNKSSSIKAKIKNDPNLPKVLINCGDRTQSLTDC